MNIPSGTVLKDYTIVNLTGRGAFSSVFQAVHNKTGAKVALKVILAETLKDPMQKAMVENEISIFKIIDHPLLVEFYESFFDKGYFVVVLEFVEGGSILSYINKFGKLSEDEARHYFCQFIHVLEYLQKKCNVAHRDLKAENVLLDQNHNIRLIDFGFSHLMSNSIPVINGPCGSPAYAAPEVLKNQPFTPMSDFWSAGVFLYGITMGTLPFVDQNIQRLMQKIVYTEPKYSPNMSNELKDLISKLIKKNYSQRITFNEIWRHPWITKYRGLLNMSNLTSITRLPIRNTILSKLTSHIDENSLVKMITGNQATNESVEYKILIRQENVSLLQPFSQVITHGNLHSNFGGDIPDNNATNSLVVDKSAKTVSIEPSKSPSNVSVGESQPKKQDIPATKDNRQFLPLSSKKNPVFNSSITLPSSHPSIANKTRLRIATPEPSPIEKQVKKEPEPQACKQSLNDGLQGSSSGMATSSPRQLTRQEQLQLLFEKKQRRLSKGQIKAENVILC